MASERARRTLAIVAGILIMLGSISVLTCAGYRAWYRDGLVMKPPAFCPTGTKPQLEEGIRSPGHTAIVIDTSNEISSEDGDLAFLRIKKWARGISVFQRVSIWGLGHSAEEAIVRREEPRCVPKQGEDANRLYENPIFVEAEFRRFLAYVKGILQDLLGRDEADESPILEALAELVESDERIDSFVLVSDMLQNTSWSHYPDSTGVRGSSGIPAECRRITASGRVKSVHVYYIVRGLPYQPPEWPSPWWRECLKGIELLAM